MGPFQRYEYRARVKNTLLEAERALVEAMRLADTDEGLCSLTPKERISLWRLSRKFDVYFAGLRGLV